jgi:single-strand DNA-binding protein
MPAVSKRGTKQQSKQQGKQQGKQQDQQRDKQRDRQAAAVVNEVRLVGRLSRPPEERVLPSGDVVWVFRVVVGRSLDARRPRQMVDALECVAWSARARRSVAGWAVDDVVEVNGALRRRFFRVGGAVASRVEVEMASGRVIRRAASG